MSINKNKYSVCVVKKWNKSRTKTYIVGYLSNRDIEQGRDSRLDMQGYIIESL